MTRLFSTMLIFAAVITIAAPVNAEEYDVSRVPATAQWAVSADVEAFLKTEIGEFVLGEANKTANSDKLAVLENLTGLDVRKDIRSITLYGDKYDIRTAVAVVEGRFEKEKLLPLLRTSRPVEEIQAGTITVYKWHDSEDANSPTKAGAFVRDDLVVIARDVETLKQSIATLKGEGATSSASDAPSGTYLSLLLADVSALGENGAVAAVAGKVRDVRLSAGESSGEFRVNLSAVTVDAAAAGEFAQVVQGLLASLSLMQGAQREGKPVISPEAAAILRDVKVSAEGATVGVSLRVPAQQVLDLINWAMAQAREKELSRVQKEQSAPPEGSDVE